MFTVKLEKECGCFKRSDFSNNVQFGSKDDALAEALNMSKEMNDLFCQKHEFNVVEEGDLIQIQVSEQARSGCCGGGHCS